MVTLLCFMVGAVLALFVVLVALNKTQEQRAYEEEWDQAQWIVNRAFVRCAYCREDTQSFIQVQHTDGSYQAMCSYCQQEHELVQGGQHG